MQLLNVHKSQFSLHNYSKKERACQQDLPCPVRDRCGHFRLAASPEPAYCSRLPCCFVTLREAAVMHLFAFERCLRQAKIVAQSVTCSTGLQDQLTLPGNFYAYPYMTRMG